MISFGLVNIPVKLFNVVKNNSVRFHQLRKSDGCRIAYKKYCPTDGEEVTDNTIVRGYEISPDRYITITPEELDAVAAKANHSIEIEDFVRLEQINPIYYDRSFYVTPDKGAAKSYSLLLKALESKERVGIARFVQRNKEYLAALRPLQQEVLGLSTLVFHEEIVSPELFGEEIPTAEPDNRELEMAKALIKSLTGNFEPTKYHDKYRQAVMELIEKKGRSHTETLNPAPTTEKAKVINIMEALEASLAAAKKKSPGETGRKKREAIH
jgi:DNA end-binding protein Ku